MVELSVPVKLKESKGMFKHMKDIKYTKCLPDEALHFTHYAPLGKGNLWALGCSPTKFLSLPDDVEKLPLPQRGQQGGAGSQGSPHPPWLQMSHRTDLRRGQQKGAVGSPAPVSL